MITPARIAIIMLLTLGLVAAACSDNDGYGGADAPAATNIPGAGAPTVTQRDMQMPDGAPVAGPPEVTGEATVTDSGLQIIDVTVGDGDEAVAGGTVTVHYTLWLEDGTQVESSVGGDPVTFELTGLIAAWQEGIPGMKADGKRRLIVPPELGYGEAGSPPNIPPNATLVFDIELLGVQ